MKRRALVIGFGLSGRSAALFLLKQGWEVVAYDEKRELKSDPHVRELIAKGVRLCTQFSYELPVDLVVLSPGVPFHHPLVQGAKGIDVIGEAELAARFLPKRPWIGVTGTNGKTTVTLFLSHLLRAHGKEAHALGNIGDPLTAHPCEDPSEVLVVELSSYQLETMQTKVLSHSLLLNVTPDHLDRYSNMDDYAQAKARIQGITHGLVVVNAKTKRQWPHLFQEGVVTFGFEPDADVYWDGELVHAFGKKVRALPDSLRGVKTHDVENWLAAWVVAHAMGIDADGFRESLNAFRKPPHRIEYVTTVSGVAFYDDSKGTNLDATMRAVEAMSSPVILIAGGIHKGASYLPWKEAFGGRVKAIVAIGQAAPLIQQELEGHFPVERVATLQEAVETAFGKAEKGDVILLSPGCSSFDMFRDYAHRGEEFQRFARGLGVRV